MVPKHLRSDAGNVDVRKISQEVFPKEEVKWSEEVEVEDVFQERPHSQNIYYGILLYFFYSSVSY
jgi:hypothetical protein